MAQLLEPQNPARLPPEQVLNQLRALATRLRTYRIHVRANTLPTESLDQPGNDRLLNELHSPEEDDANEQHNFLQAYRQELLGCLDHAIAQVVSDRLLLHQRKRPPSDQQFLKALQLFHCQQQSMGAIAPQIGLTRQDQVSRLLKLKPLRVDIRHQVLVQLRDRVQALAHQYLDRERLATLDHRLETALEEQMDHLMDAAAKEVNVAHRPLSSLFARRLCHYLDTRRN